MKKLLIGILPFLASSALSSSTEKKEFNGNGLEQLSLVNTSGSVKISTSEDDKAHVTAHKVVFGEKCSLQMLQSGSELSVKVKKESGFFSFLNFFDSTTCKVNFEIKLPAKVALNLKNGSGDLQVIDTVGKIEFEIGSGDTDISANSEKVLGKSGSGFVKISGKIGESTLTVGSGNIDINGLSGIADLKTGSGDLRVSYNSVPSTGSLNLKSGSGSATVFLPKDSKVSTDLLSGSGKVYNELDEATDAGFKISMKTGSGDLTLKKL